MRLQVLCAFTKIKLQFMNSYYSSEVATTVVAKKYVPSLTNDCLTILSLIEMGILTLLHFSSIIVSFCFGCLFASHM